MCHYKKSECCIPQGTDMSVARDAILLKDIHEKIYTFKILFIGKQCMSISKVRQQCSAVDKDRLFHES